MVRSSATLAASALLPVYGAYSLWSSAAVRHALGFAWGITWVVAGLGLLFRRRWSEYLVCLLCLSLAATWGYTVAWVWYRGWPYADWPTTVISLAPGGLLVGTCLAIALHVFWFFRRVRPERATAPGTATPPLRLGLFGNIAVGVRKEAKPTEARPVDPHVKPGRVRCRA